jgi:hypothetical protein
MCVRVGAETSWDTLLEVSGHLMGVVPYYHVGPGDPTQGVRPGRGFLYLLSCRSGPGPLEDFFYFHYKNIVVKITLENSMNLSNFRVAMVQEATITRILYFPLL